MAKDDKEIVSRVSGVLAQNLGSDCFDLWFSSRTSFAWNGARLQVFATDVFTLDRLRNKLRGSIESACRQVTGSADVEFRLVPGPASGVSARPVPSKRNAVLPSRTVDESAAESPVAEQTSSPRSQSSVPARVPASVPETPPATLANPEPRPTRKSRSTSKPIAASRPLFEELAEPMRGPASSAVALENDASSPKRPGEGSQEEISPTPSPGASTQSRSANRPAANRPRLTSPPLEGPAATSLPAKGPAATSSASKRSNAKVLAESAAAADQQTPKGMRKESRAARNSGTKTKSAANRETPKLTAKSSPMEVPSAMSASKGGLSKGGPVKRSPAAASSSKSSSAAASPSKSGPTAKWVAPRDVPSRKPLPYAVPTTPPTRSTTASSASMPAPMPASVPASTPAVLPARLPAHWSHVVVGPCNQLAMTAVQSVARQPGSVSPLYLYGPSGSGKSLLVDCLLQDSRRRFPGRRAVMLSAEQFTSQFVEALKGTGLPSFRRKYRDVDLLILDDVHFFAGKKATLIELQSTLDMLQRSGRQLVLTADRPPQEIVGLGKELGNRLCGGLVCRLEPPDAETRMGILRHHCQQRGVKAPSTVLDLIVDGVQGDARLLSGALWRLQAASQAWSRPITRELAEGTLADLLRVSRRVIRLPDIEQAVCEAFGLDSRSLQSDGKQRAVSQPRMLAMWLARKYTRSALSEIGQYFGRRSHTSVIAANRKIDQLMDSEAPMPRSGGADAAFLQAARRVELMLRTGS